MESAAKVLPKDLKTLQKLVRDQQHQLDQQSQRLNVTQAQLHVKEALLQSKDQRIDVLEAMVRLLRHHQYGRRSEQHPGQGELFDEVECLSADGTDPLAGGAAPLIPPPTTPPKKRGRKPLPAELPRVIQVYELDDIDKHCPCGCTLTEIGEDISEQLDIIPAVIQVIRHVRKRYACKSCEQTLKTAPLPPQPIAKSQASAGLLAHVAIAKYQDALPLYRQEKLFKRIGAEIPRNTLANWMIQCGSLIQPLINLYRDQLLAGPVIQCDETVVQVLKEKGKPANSNSYMWVQVGGLPDQKVVLYDYDASRSGQVPCRLLDGYQGYLQTDGYEGYNQIAAQSGITHLVCWAHARRKFVEAMNSLPKKKRKPGKILNWIAKLYQIEKAIREQNPEQRLQVRQEHSLLILQTIRKWLDKTLPSVPPKTTQGKAIHYLNKYWDKLTVYCSDGQLSIDNNITENAIRPFVIGRKNWLFSDTTKGATASASIYSLIETAKANGVEPYHYLRTVLTKLPQAAAVEDFEQLLPWHVKNGVH